MARWDGTGRRGVRSPRHIGHGRVACEAIAQHSRDEHNDNANHASAHHDRSGVIGTETPLFITFGWVISRWSGQWHGVAPVALKPYGREGSRIRNGLPGAASPAASPRGT
jgi:hypothetical protein